MADIALTVTIPDGLGARTVAAEIWHYGYNPDDPEYPPSVADLKDRLEEDIYEYFIRQRVGRYEGSMAGDAAKQQALDDFEV